MKTAPERQTPWAVRAETLPVLARALSGELSAEDRQHLAGPQDGGSSRVTGGVAVLPLRGLITPRASLLSLLFGGGGGLESFRSGFREALADQEVGSILLDVDSPGGSTDLVSETAAEIRAARGAKPIVAIANTDSASAAYWIAAQADELVVTPSGEVGSIGVFILHEDISGFDEQLGVKTTLISAGKYKTEGNPYEPLDDAARASFEQTVDEFYDLFVGDVAEGRGTSAASVRAGYGEGRMVTAARAVSLGMADRVDTFEGTVSRLVGRPISDPLPTENKAKRTRLLELAGHHTRPYQGEDEHA